MSVDCESAGAQESDAQRLCKSRTSGQSLRCRRVLGYKPSGLSGLRCVKKCKRPSRRLTLAILPTVTEPLILLGTSSFTATGWNGSFYPRGMKPSDYLAYYAERFHSVEVDSTFYACPTARTVENWKARTPDGFIFSVKVPQTITHDKVLVDCQGEWKEFLETMDILGPKLGPIVFQFPFFSRSVFRDGHEFADRLIPFLKKLPSSPRFAVEIRNRDWLGAELANLLRDHKIALVLQDRSWMIDPLEMKFDPITADWTYIRWLGDRREIEARTLTWDKAVVDRSAELTSWVDFCYQVKKRGVMIYAYANNHYSGHAPATIEQFRDLWKAKGFGEISRPKLSARQQGTLFPA
jgi:uncharacterized protein YecE (DUF72 family)